MSRARMTVLALLAALLFSPAFAQDINNPNTGAPYFRAYLSANQSVTNATVAKINFDTVDFDIGTYYSTSTHVYKPLVSGTYNVCFTYIPNATFVTATDAVFGYISKNGTIGAGGVSQNLLLQPSIAGTASDGFSVAACSLVQMNGSTDTVEIDARVNGTTPLINGSANRVTQFSASRIGP